MFDRFRSARQRAALRDGAGWRLAGRVVDILDRAAALCRRDEIRAHVSAHKAQRLARFEELHLFPDQVIRVPSLQVSGLPGLWARAEAHSLTGARADVDPRHGWLVIAGPVFQWQIRLVGDRRSVIPEAGQFAAALNTAAGGLPGR